MFPVKSPHIIYKNWNTIQKLKGKQTPLWCNPQAIWMTGISVGISILAGGKAVSLVVSLSWSLPTTSSINIKIISN